MQAQKNKSKQCVFEPDEPPARPKPRYPKSYTEAAFSSSKRQQHFLLINGCKSHIRDNTREFK